MKKISIFLVVLLLTFSLVSCDLAQVGDLLDDVSDLLGDYEDLIDQETNESGDPVDPDQSADPSDPVDPDDPVDTDSPPPASGNYPFSGLGLTADQEEQLKEFYDTCTAGEYSLFGDVYAYICQNGDLIIYDEDGDHTVYDMTKRTKAALNKRNDGYSTYDLHEWGENKKQFFTDLSTATLMFTMTQRGDGETFADATAFLSAQGVTLLPVGKIENDKPDDYELLNYRSYEGEIDKTYILTGFMHPASRYLTFLEPYQDKIAYWEVNYINDPRVYTECKVSVLFTEGFTAADYKSMRDALVGMGLSNIYGGSFAEVNESGYNSCQGQLPVYTMPYEEEGEIWYDDYSIAGFVQEGEEGNIPYLMTISYLYSYWYDGGSFATYVCRADGLWRYVDDTPQLMIAPDGTKVAP